VRFFPYYKGLIVVSDSPDVRLRHHVKESNHRKSHYRVTEGREDKEPYSIELIGIVSTRCFWGVEIGERVNMHLTHIDFLLLNIDKGREFFRITVQTLHNFTILRVTR